MDSRPVQAYSDVKINLIDRSRNQVEALKTTNQPDVTSGCLSMVDEEATPTNYKPPSFLYLDSERRGTVYKEPAVSRETRVASADKQRKRRVVSRHSKSSQDLIPMVSRVKTLRSAIMRREPHIKGHAIGQKSISTQERPPEKRESVQIESILNRMPQHHVNGSLASISGGNLVSPKLNAKSPSGSIKSKEFAIDRLTLLRPSSFLSKMKS